MNRLKKILAIRQLLTTGKPVIGSWMQIPNSSVAEIMGQSGYDWVAVDLEHGSVCTHQLPDLFRALELGDTLPLVRIAHAHSKDCKQALDAGAGGIIVPMIENAQQLIQIRDACCWPPTGTRGVGFSRANLFGENFDHYTEEAQAPLLIAMIENIGAVNNLEEILKVKGLDAVFIGPYDLSASIGHTADFENPEYKSVNDKIHSFCKKQGIPCGIHVVKPDPEELRKRIDTGYQFIAYSIDSVFLAKSARHEHTTG